MREHLAYGLGHTPANVAALLGHAPVESAHDIAGCVGLFFVDSVCGMPKGYGRAQSEHGLKGEQTHERAYGTDAFLCYGLQMIAPLRGFELSANLEFLCTKAGQGKPP